MMFRVGDSGNMFHWGKLSHTKAKVAGFKSLNESPTRFHNFYVFCLTSKDFPSIFSGTGFMDITDSPSTISPPPTTTTTSTTTTTTTTTTNKKNQFDHFLDPHSSAGRGDIDPYIDGSPSYVYDERPENDLVFGVMTSAGYFFITIVLMIGVIMGDNQSFTVGESNYFGPFSSTLLTL